MTRTAKVKRLNAMHPEPLLDIHPDDADALHIETAVWQRSPPVVVTSPLAPT